MLLKYIRRIAAFVLLASIITSLCACGDSTERYGNYRVLKKFEAQQMSIGFRKDDFVRYYVEAAIKVLAADGTISRIAHTWFGEDKTTFESDAAALDNIGNIPVRTLIIGLDGEGFPMSYTEGSSFAGFDVDVIKAVCARLGWTVYFIPIEAEDTYIELSSGNIDCAWGGLVLDNSAGKYVTLAPYMENQLALIVRDDGKIKRLAQLSGKTLAVDVDRKYLDALSADEQLKNSFGKITRLTGGVQACFTSLNEGKVDAIIAYSIAARYYGK